MNKDLTKDTFDFFDNVLGIKHGLEPEEVMEQMADLEAKHGEQRGALN